MKSIPPHIGWPMMIVAVLMTGVGACVITVFAARSDGGAQIVDDYYHKAIDYDEAAAQQAASDALGWQVRLETHRKEGDLHLLDITLTDAQGRPVEHLEGTVRASRPQYADAVAQVPLTPLPDRPGTYRVPVAMAHGGLWDFTIDAHRGDEHFQTSIRKDVAR